MALVLFVDELQYVGEQELAALITAMHRMAQRLVPVALVGAGLPQLRGQMGSAKSYAERMFDFPEVGPLSPDAARVAIAKPANDEGVQVDEDALAHIVELPAGIPISCKSGASTLGTPPQDPPSHGEMWNDPRSQRLQPSTRVSSGCASTA